MDMLEGMEWEDWDGGMVWEGWEKGFERHWMEGKEGYDGMEG